MGILDLVTLIVENLARRKGRVALTAVGVIIGTAAVVLLVSLGVGLQQNAADQLGGIGDLTKIQVYPTYGEFDPSTGQPIGGTMLTDQTIADISALPGVTAVIPQDYFQGYAQIKLDRLEGGSQMLGIGTTDLGQLGVKAQQGSLEVKRGTAVVGAMVSQSFYDPRLRPGQEPPPPPDLYDKQLVLNLVKYTPDGQEVRKTVRLKVGGVLAEARDEPDWSIYIPLDELTGYNTWVTGQRIDRNKVGYNNMIVRVA
ncbi:MAG: ABC transporter permease, partial [Anaerolineales bacterium]|nr:ABC transporter permease [Anaerolineales bacterium]